MLKRRWIARLLLAAGLLVTILWLASMRWSIIYQHHISPQTPGPDFQAMVGNGAFWLTYHKSQHIGIDQHWLFAPSDGPVRWGGELWQAPRFPGRPKRSSPMRSTVIPLWLPAAALLVSGVVLRRAIKRLQAISQTCPGCGYSLVGLPEGNPCPECGKQQIDNADD